MTCFHIVLLAYVQNLVSLWGSSLIKLVYKFLLVLDLVIFLTALSFQLHTVIVIVIVIVIIHSAKSETVPELQNEVIMLRDTVWSCINGGKTGFRPPRWLKLTLWCFQKGMTFEDWTIGSEVIGSVLVTV